MEGSEGTQLKMSGPSRSGLVALLTGGREKNSSQFTGKETRPEEGANTLLRNVFYPSTRRNIPEDLNLHQHRRGQVKGKVHPTTGHEGPEGE